MCDHTTSYRNKQVSLHKAVLLLFVVVYKVVCGFDNEVIWCTCVAGEGSMRFDVLEPH